MGICRGCGKKYQDMRDALCIDCLKTRKDQARDIIETVYERLITINCILADENIDRIVENIEKNNPWLEEEV